LLDDGPRVWPSLCRSCTAERRQWTPPSDIKYCNALAKSYSSLFPVQEGMPAADVVTLSRCDSDPQATIAALERKLKDKKIELPSDARIAQPPGSTGNAQ
jgi:hypothetical protein